MWINLGRILMSGVWSMLVFNLFHPFPSPLRHFLNVAMIFMVLMHGLQLVLFKSTLKQGENPIPPLQQSRLFLFGVFELLAWQKKQHAQNPAKK